MAQRRVVSHGQARISSGTGLPDRYFRTTINQAACAPGWSTVSLWVYRDTAFILIPELVVFPGKGESVWRPPWTLW